MVIVLLLPTLQIPVMDRLSSTHLVITQTGIIRGYEKEVRPHTGFISFLELFLKCLHFLSAPEGWLPTELQAWSWSGTQRSVKRQHSGDTVLKRPFIMTVTNLHHTENSKFKNAFAPA